MSLGFVGSHRVGKTTLAEAVSNQAVYPLALTSAASAYDKLGIDPLKTISFKRRMALQNMILDDAEAVWSKQRDFFVTDRTPIDMIAYTLADIGGGSKITPEQQGVLLAYIDRCMKVTNRYFSILILIQPGIPVVWDATKATAAPNKAYMEHLNMLMKGYMNEFEGSRFTFDRELTDLERRVRCATSCIDRLTDRMNQVSMLAELH